jgi:hypothetical protein
MLWTGGWDSTFQLLQMSIVHGARVAPLYLIDEDRRSTGAELLTMKRIKSRLRERFPDAWRQLEPTRYAAVSDVAPDAAITAAFEALRKTHSIGIQYDWLARFCASTPMPGLQLCIHKDDRAHAVVSERVEPVEDGSHGRYRMQDRFSGTAHHRVFGQFTFPVLELTKQDMATQARAQGFEELMGMTWFCHDPRKGLVACGVCGPCRYTIEEGLGWRVPQARRLLGRFTGPMRRVARSARDHLRR